MKYILLLFLFCSGTLSAQKKYVNSKYAPKEYVQLTHPDWSKNATIYEVNIRQYTPEGTFKAFEAHLPRLKDLGVDIIWLMPIHPIGVKHRKGTLGSYYSVKDYYGVNPDFGTIQDFKNLVKKIYSMGMFVILDWVANHSAWDNPLATKHPGWYTKTPEGNFQPTPWYDWDDVIDFDYNQPGLRKYMADALKHWVKETNIDGYRCDVAGFIPVDFWNGVRQELDAIKPVFMLAEWESRDMLKSAFDMTYSWSLWDKMKAAVNEPNKLAPLVEYLAHDVSTHPRDGYRMTFTDNHDKNSWEGNQYSNFGNALPLCMAIACTVNGMPLVYSGQEAGLNKSLRFFEKDTIVWQDHANAALYKKLFALKHRNKALWNGKWGGEMIRIVNDQPDNVISFYRQTGKQRVVCVFNFAAKPVSVLLNAKYIQGNYSAVATNAENFSSSIELKAQAEINLPAWGYLVLEQ